MIADPEQTVKVPRVTLIPYEPSEQPTLKHRSFWAEMEAMAKRAELRPQPMDRCELYHIPGLSPVDRLLHARRMYMDKHGVAPFWIYFSSSLVFEIPAHIKLEFMRHGCTIAAIRWPAEWVIVWGCPYE